MLSFGCVFPFLSFVLFLTIIGQTKYTEYRIGQYIESIVTCDALHLEDKVQRVRQLNEELRDIQHKLIRSLWQLLPCLGPFYGIFVFDIIGDASSTKDAIFAPIILSFTTAIIYLTPYLHTDKQRNIINNDNNKLVSIHTSVKKTQVRPNE